MAYFTGTANSPADLLLKLKSHAESIGWITDRSSADEWCLHNADGYWSIKALANRFEMGSNTGFDNTKAWDKQPGTSIRISGSYRYPTVFSLAATPFVAYHLFVTGDYLHGVVEIASGKFRHIAIGTLDKRGAVYNGGQYVSSTYRRNADGTNNVSYDSNLFDDYSYFDYLLSSRVRVDGQDGASSPYWALFTNNSSGGINRAIGLGRGYASTSHPSALLVDTSANALTGGTLLIPCTIYTIGAENRTRMIGEVKDFAVCRMDYLSPGDTITVGQEQWRVFPPIERTALDTTGSGMVGYAYKVIP